jgi:hypothetical protein
VKKFLWILLLLVSSATLTGISYAIDGPPPKWTKASGYLLNKTADSVGVVTQNNDTMWFSNAGIHFNGGAVLDSALLDSIYNGLGRFSASGGSGLWATKGTADTIYYSNAAGTDSVMFFYTASGWQMGRAGLTQIDSLRVGEDVFRIITVAGTDSSSITVAFLDSIRADEFGGAGASLWDSTAAVNIDKFALIGRENDTTMIIVVDTLTDTVLVYFGSDESKNVRVKGIDRLYADTVTVGDYKVSLRHDGTFGYLHLGSADWVNLDGFGLTDLGANNTLDVDTAGLNSNYQIATAKLADSTSGGAARAELADSATGAQRTTQIIPKVDAAPAAVAGQIYFADSTGVGYTLPNNVIVVGTGGGDPQTISFYPYARMQGNGLVNSLNRLHVNPDGTTIDTVADKIQVDTGTIATHAALEDSLDRYYDTSATVDTIQALVINGLNDSLINRLLNASDSMFGSFFVIKEGSNFGPNLWMIHRDTLNPDSMANPGSELGVLQWAVKEATAGAKIAAIACVIEDTTTASRNGRLEFYTNKNGTYDLRMLLLDDGRLMKVDDVGDTTLVDSLYLVQGQVKSLLGDSLANYSLTATIAATYETITNVAKIGDDTTSFKAAVDSVAAWDNGGLDSANLAADAVGPEELADSNVAAQGDLVTVAGASADQFGFKTTAELGFMSNLTTIDADGQRITDLAHATSDTDAVNLGQMKDTIGEIRTEISSQVVNDPFFNGDIEWTGHSKQWNRRNDIDVANAHAVPASARCSINIPSAYWGVWDLGPTDTGDSLHAIHPSVVYVPDKLWGYKYWMAMTPYPGGNNQYENPCLRASNDGITWVLPDIGGFSPNDPLFDLDDFTCGSSEYLSDADLFYGKDGKLWMMFRYNCGAIYYLYVTSTDDGYTWTSPVQIIDGDDALAIGRDAVLISPSVIIDTSGTYRMYCVETSPTAGTNPENAIQTWTATTPDGTWTRTLSSCSFPNRDTSTGDFWHLNVVSAGADNVVLLITMSTNNSSGGGNEELVLAKSGSNLVTFTQMSDTVMFKAAWHNDGTYRASGIWVTEGDDLALDLWYSGHRTISGPEDDWGIGYTRIYFDDTSFFKVDTGGGNYVEPGKDYVLKAGSGLDFNFKHSSNVKDTLTIINTAVSSAEYVSFEQVYGRADVIGDSVTLALPKYASGITLTTDSTNQGSDVDSFYIGGSIPFAASLMDSICFTYLGDGTADIDSLILMGPDRSNGLNRADSIWATIDCSLDDVSSWTRFAWYVNETSLQAGDNFAVKFRCNLATDEDWIQIGWIQARVTR